jgi:hypothetical protein
MVVFNVTMDGNANVSCDWFGKQKLKQYIYWFLPFFGCDGVCFANSAHFCFKQSSNKFFTSAIQSCVLFKFSWAHENLVRLIDFNGLNQCCGSNRFLPSSGSDFFFNHREEMVVLYVTMDYEAPTYPVMWFGKQLKQYIYTLVPAIFWLRWLMFCQLRISVFKQSSNKFFTSAIYCSLVYYLNLVGHEIFWVRIYWSESVLVIRTIFDRFRIRLSKTSGSCPEYFSPKETVRQSALQFL